MLEQKAEADRLIMQQPARLQLNNVFFALACTVAFCIARGFIGRRRRELSLSLTCHSLEDECLTLDARTFARLIGIWKHASLHSQWHSRGR